MTLPGPIVRTTPPLVVEVDDMNVPLKTCTLDCCTSITPPVPRALFFRKLVSVMLVMLSPNEASTPPSSSAVLLEKLVALMLVVLLSST